MLGVVGATRLGFGSQHRAHDVALVLPHLLQLLEAILQEGLVYICCQLATAHTVKVITVHRALVVADGPHSITECGPKARTLFSLSLSEAEDAHTLTSVKADGSTLSGRCGSAWTSGFRV